MNKAKSMKVGAVKPMKAHMSRFSRTDIPCMELFRFRRATNHPRSS